MRPEDDLSSSAGSLLRHELERQRTILIGEAPARLIATALGYSISAAYLPVAIVAMAAIMNLLAELLADILLRDIASLLRSTTRRRILSACTFAHEACFVLPPALMWHLDDPMVKAFAVGMTASKMMHIATVRAIHLPMRLSRSRLEMLVDSAAGLGVLLDDILDLAAVEEGRLPIRPETINPRSILSASVGLFRPQAEASGLHLDLTLDPNVPAAARADGRRLRQCVSNILSNALKYTVRGQVRATARMEAGDILQIDVTDTGEGVPEALRDAIFEPFRRGSQAQPGNGLGLTISRTLARRMGGDLVLIPSEAGAWFRLTLPLEPADVAFAAPLCNLPKLDLRGRLDLVVDDIASDRLVAAAYLRLLGAQVMEAESGEAALCLLYRMRPWAVLLEMNMPGLSGL